MSHERLDAPSPKSRTLSFVAKDKGESGEEEADNENLLRLAELGVSWGLGLIWDFRKLGVPYFGVLIIRILLFRVLY